MYYWKQNVMLYTFPLKWKSSRCCYRVMVTSCCMEIPFYPIYFRIAWHLLIRSHTNVGNVVSPFLGHDIWWWQGKTKKLNLMNYCHHKFQSHQNVWKWNQIEFESLNAQSTCMYTPECGNLFPFLFCGGGL